jgi:hypothetical protein
MGSHCRRCHEDWTKVSQLPPCRNFHFEKRSDLRLSAERLDWPGALRNELHRLQDRLSKGKNHMENINLGSNGSSSEVLSTIHWQALHGLSTVRIEFKPYIDNR